MAFKICAFSRQDIRPRAYHYNSNMEFCCFYAEIRDLFNFAKLPFLDFFFDVSLVSADPCIFY